MASVQKIKPPVQPFQQRRQLRRRQTHHAVFDLGPAEDAVLQPFGEVAREVRLFGSWSRHFGAGPAAHVHTVVLLAYLVVELWGGLR
jgi:hypothetical protein